MLHKKREYLAFVEELEICYTRREGMKGILFTKRKGKMIINNAILLRIRDVELLNEIQLAFETSRMKSMNEFMNMVLNRYFLDKDHEVLDLLSLVEDKVNATYEMVKEIYERK